MKMPDVLGIAKEPEQGICFTPLCKNFMLDLLNKSVGGNFFPDEMKDGDVSALLKNSDSFQKKNHRPITILSSVSNVFERLLPNQMLPFVNKFLSPKICGYRKGYNTQHALLKLVETCKKTSDNKGFVGDHMNFCLLN